MTHIVRLSDYRKNRSRVYFTRQELSQLLTIYSGRVAAGDWKDYAIDHAQGVAVFSVFRNAHDKPAFAIAKAIGPRGAHYTLFEQRRKVVRSSSLNDVLAPLRPHLRLVTE